MLRLRGLFDYQLRFFDNWEVLPVESQVDRYENETPPVLNCKNSGQVVLFGFLSFCRSGVNLVFYKPAAADLRPIAHYEHILSLSQVAKIKGITIGSCACLQIFLQGKPAADIHDPYRQLI